MKRVGREISAGSYWSERAAQYAARVDGPYHAHRRAVVWRLLGDVSGRRVLDFGCGEGVFLVEAAEAGADVLGIDPNDELAEAACRRVPGAEVMVGGVERLADVPSDSVDVVLAANVLAYMTNEEESRYYREAHRILHPDGVMVVTHSNELFDMYTLNRYSVEFFQAHFDAEIAALLVAGEEPDRITFNIRENPLAYRFKLDSYGFEEMQQEFINLHPAPPLLMSADFADIDARTYADTLAWPADQRWKLLFQCSMFGSRARRRRDT